MKMSFYCPAHLIQQVQSLVKQYDARFVGNPYPISERERTVSEWHVSLTTDHLPIEQSQTFHQSLNRLLYLKVRETVRKPNLKARLRIAFRQAREAWKS